MKNEALEKLQKLKAEVPLIKPRIGMQARNYADAIIHLPEDRWQQELDKVPEDHRALATEHVKSFGDMKFGMVRAFADKVMQQKTLEGRRRVLATAPLPIKDDVAVEVKRRFEERKR